MSGLVAHASEKTRPVALNAPKGSPGWLTLPVVLTDKATRPFGRKACRDANKAG